MNEICNVCRGAGNFFSAQSGTLKNRRMRWFACPQCFGDGTTKVHSPVFIKVHWKKNNKLTKINNELNERFFHPDDGVMAC